MLPWVGNLQITELHGQPPPSLLSGLLCVPHQETRETTHVNVLQ